MNNKIILEYLYAYARKKNEADKILAELYEKIKKEEQKQ